jgi:hypothetical protein
MTDTPRVLSLASAAALLLALSQPGLAAQEAATTAVGPASPAAEPAAPAAEPAAAAQPAPVAEAPPATPPAAEPPAAGGAPAAQASRAEAARANAEARRAEMDADRNRRYQDLRQRASEVGLELPETPPWEETPAMPVHRDAAPPDWDAMRKEREAMRERVKSITPEERKATREAHWQKMRERAAERGVEMPETPPWEEAEQRYKAAQEQFDRYRKIVDEMTDEQLEAARALFGRGEDGPQPMQPMAPPRMPQHGYGYGPQGGYPGYGPYQGGPGAMGRPPMPYYEGGMEQAPPPPRGGLPY